MCRMHGSPRFVVANKVTRIINCSGRQAIGVHLAWWRIIVSEKKAQT